MCRSARKSFVRPGCVNTACRYWWIVSLSKTPVGIASPQRREGLHRPPGKGPAQVGEQRPREDGRHRPRPPQVFPERRAHEHVRGKRAFRLVALDEDAVDLGDRDRIGERGGEEAARAHAHVDVEVAEIDALERLLEGHQRPDLVDGAERPAPGQGEAEDRPGSGTARPARCRLRLRAGCRRGRCPGHSLPGRARARAVQPVDARLQLGHLARQRPDVLRRRDAELGDGLETRCSKTFSRWETASTVFALASPARAHATSRAFSAFAKAERRLRASRAAPCFTSASKAPTADWRTPEAAWTPASKAFCAEARMVLAAFAGVTPAGRDLRGVVLRVVRAMIRPFVSGCDSCAPRGGGPGRNAPASGSRLGERIRGDTLNLRGPGQRGCRHAGRVYHSAGTTQRPPRRDPCPIS